MALQPFSFPFPETRFFQVGNSIYKFKIRGGNSFRLSEDELLEKDNFDQEIEEIVRTVLGNLDCLQPFSTPHFTVFPYKKSWGKVCKHSMKKLSFYPFVIILYLERSAFRGNQTEMVTQQSPMTSDEPRLKRSRRDSPLEEAIIKEMIQDMETESKISVTGVAELEHSVMEAENDSTHSTPTGELQTTQSNPEKERAPEKPGILKRLVRNLFPFVFRSSEN